ncbi:TonB-dependent siderophore receptor [Myxacorys almedinensis]|nr:TonB-dependent siderophore receptor [Myxacorys almedinensis]
MSHLRPRPATTVKEWVAQIEAATVQITGVTLNRTDTGLEIVLQTAEGKPLQVDATKFRTEGTSLIADIPNAVLALPTGQEFVADNPVADVTTIRIAQQDANTIRVSVTGNNALPKSEVTLKAGGLAYSLNPDADEPDEEIVATGERRETYRVPNASTATRTDTPLRDIPQSIQVVPEAVLRDQNVVHLEEVLRNVPSGNQISPSTQSDSITSLRGFPIFPLGGNFLRNGLRERLGAVPVIFTNIDRIEFLQGPASVLFGPGNPGGTINLITKQPLREPFYSLDATIGSFDFYQVAADLSGPLNDSRNVLYRLNASYLDRNSFIDIFEENQFFVAPVLSWAIGDSTKLTIEGDYTDSQTSYVPGLPAVGTVLPNPNGRIPRNRYLGEPDTALNTTIARIGYSLEHQFSNDWSLKNAFRFSSLRLDEVSINPDSLEPNNRTLNRFSRFTDIENDAYELALDLTGNFSTGSIEHQLILGANLGRTYFDIRDSFGSVAPIDLFNPVYGQPFETPPLTRINTFIRKDLGIYVQDQVTLLENLKLLLGVRFDIFDQTDRFFRASTGITESNNQSGSAFSPRVGIVYQPIRPISLYASYTSSFVPVIGVAFDGSEFQPERGTQYEVGIKADVNDRLSTTLAFYNLTRSNALTSDPDNQGFSIQTGEQRSRGVELNVAGEILPGWNITAGYAYTNARITRDNDLPVGNRLDNVPENSFNLWTTYQIQQGTLRGLGFGLGLFYVGERQANLDNTFSLPSYLRTDATIFYQRDRLRASLNFQNLFNVDYFQSSYGELEVFPGEPFTVQGKISWEF